MSLDHSQRYGMFTSSEIGNLCTSDKKGGFGKPALSYIEKKVYESRLGRRIQNETTSKSMSWGRAMELFSFQKLGIEYVLTSDLTIKNKDIENWVGSPDGYKEKDSVLTVFDIKCPYLLQYCRLADMCISGDVQKFKDEEPIYFWQLVSGSILTGATHGELVITIPYRDELHQLKGIIDKINSEDAYEYYWIEAALNSGKFDQLPHIIRDTYYQNLYTLNFKIEQSDIDFLTERVIMANEIRKNWGVPEIKKS